MPTMMVRLGMPGRQFDGRDKILLGARIVLQLHSATAPGHMEIRRAAASLKYCIVVRDGLDPVLNWQRRNENRAVAAV